MARRPNVLFVVLDSVRFNRTSVGGHHRETTPHLERISNASQGTSFRTAMAHGRYTLPSTASILSGRYPAEHRVGFERNALDGSIPTVAESFRDAGYATACVSNNAFVAEETGLARGFDTFVVKPTSPAGIVRTVGVGPTARWLSRLRRHSAGFTTERSRHSTAYLTAALVRQRLAAFESRAEPFFLYVHFDQPHRPYSPPLPWLREYASEFDMSTDEAVGLAMDVHHDLERYVADGVPFTDDQWAALTALYDAGIEYTDTFVGQLFDRVQRRFDDTIVVVTTDHGEHLGERGALGHKYVLDDALLNVPLVTWGLDASSTDAPVQHTDVMRTLLEVADARADFVDGIDLRDDARAFAVSQDTGRSLEPLYDHNPEFDASRFFAGADGSLPARTSLRTGSYRYTRAADEAEPRYELSDVVHGRLEDRPDLAERLATELDDWSSERSTPLVSTTRSDDRIDEATRERLRRMGYLEEDL